MTTLWDQSRKPRLLFVEDDIDLGNMFKIYFGDLAEVTLTARLPDALALSSSQLFDLVILDLDQPGLDEYEFMKSIRASSRKVPVIFLTQRDERSEKLQALEIGADDYISKPFDIEELKLRIRGIQSRLAGDTTTDAPPPAYAKIREFIKYLIYALSDIEELRDKLLVLRAQQNPSYRMVQSFFPIVIDRFSKYSSIVEQLGRETSDKIENEIKSFLELTQSLKKDSWHDYELDLILSKTVFIAALFREIVFAFEKYLEDGRFPEKTINKLTDVLNKLAGNPTVDAPPPSTASPAPPPPPEGKKKKKRKGK